MSEHHGVIPANTHGSEDEKPFEKFLNDRQTMNHGIGGSSLVVHSGGTTSCEPSAGGARRRHNLPSV